MKISYKICFETKNGFLRKKRKLSLSENFPVFIPVSYTHLDVYKRQEPETGFVITSVLSSGIGAVTPFGASVFLIVNVKL